MGVIPDYLYSEEGMRIDGISDGKPAQNAGMQKGDIVVRLGDVKVIGCTNRKDILDPAVTRPGRLDRLIEIPLPNKRGKMDIFKTQLLES